MRVGIFDHLGWAVVVTADADGAVVDRRRIELIEPGISAAPIHYDRGRSDSARVVELIAEARAAIARVAGAEFDALAASLPRAVRSVLLRAWPADFPTDIEAQRRPPYEARADAIMYRQVLADLARERAWVVGFYDAKSVVEQIPSDVLTGPRATLGPPWTKDHQVALAAALTA